MQVRDSLKSLTTCPTDSFVFIQMCIDGDLIISNRKTAIIVDELRKLKFRPFPTKAAARAAGEDEDALDEADEGLASDYDYLLGMAIRSLTAEKVSVVNCMCFTGLIVTNMFVRLICIGRKASQCSGREEI